VPYRNKLLCDFVSLLGKPLLQSILNGLRGELAGKKNIITFDYGFFCIGG
jgi:hypothetical protein